MNRLRIVSNIFTSITLVLFPITYSKSEEEHSSEVVFSNDHNSSVNLLDEDMCVGVGENCGHRWVTTDPNTGRKVYHLDFSHHEASKKSKYGTPPEEGAGYISGGNTRVGSYRGGSGQGFSGPIISEVLAMEAYVKAYESYAQISTSIVTTDIINFLTSHLDNVLQNELFSNDSTIDEQWIEKAADIAKGIEPVVTQLAYSTGVPNLHSSDWANIIRISTNAVKEEMYKEITYFRWNSLVGNILEELKNVFLNHQNPIKLTDSIIATTESQVHDVIDNPLDIPISYEFSEEEKLRATVQIEEHLYDIAKQMIDEYLFAPSQHNFNQQINSLEENTEESKEAMKSVNMQPVFHASNPYNRYQRDVLGIAQQKIKSEYTRAELSLLKEEELVSPQQEPYEFISPEGEFLDKNKAVYDKLRNSNPYHEQGVLAREVGLSAVEVADEEYAQGNEPEAELAFEVAETMSDIALGVMPYKGDRVFYTSLTEETAFKEVHSAQRIKDIEHTRKNFIFEPKEIKSLNNVLDLTDANVLRQLSRGLDEVLTEEQLVKLADDNPDAYDLPQIIGHTAKRNKIKQVEAVLTPAAQDMPNGKNLVLFEELP